MDNLVQLETITKTKYEKQQQSFRLIVTEENRLRGELAKLDKHLNQSCVQVGDDVSLKAIGADVIWQGWVGQRKAELNTKLAQVLAIKEHHLVQVRKAYGKLLVVQELIATAKDEKRKKFDQTQLDRAINQSIFR